MIKLSSPSPCVMDKTCITLSLTLSPLASNQAAATGTMHPRPIYTTWLNPTYISVNTRFSYLHW